MLRYLELMPFLVVSNIVKLIIVRSGGVQCGHNEKCTRWQYFGSNGKLYSGLSCMWQNQLSSSSKIRLKLLFLIITRFSTKAFQSSVNIQCILFSTLLVHIQNELIQKRVYIIIMKQSVLFLVSVDCEDFFLWMAPDWRWDIFEDFSKILKQDFFVSSTRVLQRKGFTEQHKWLSSFLDPHHH